MGAIFRKEMRTYFTTLTGYAFLGFFVLITGYFFISQNLSYNTAQGMTRLSGNYGDTLSGSLIMFLILVPVLTMRLFAEETRQKTDQLLFCAPVRIIDIVAGKFLAAVCLFIIGLGITMVFPFIISRMVTIDMAATVGSVIGYLLMGACFISVGIFISILTDNQIVAAAGTFGVLFLLLMVDNLANNAPISTASSLIFVAVVVLAIVLVVYSSTKSLLMAFIFALIGFGIEGGLYLINKTLYDGVISRVLEWFSVLNRFENFYRGIFSISDVVYYITFSAVFLYLTVNVIEKRRWS